MPVPDAIPGQRTAAVVRLRRIMQRMALLSLLAAIAAVVLVARGHDEPPIHMLIATALGVGLTVLLGTALMSLAFLSSSSGHDADAHHPENPQP